MATQVINSPVGPLQISASARGLCAVRFGPGPGGSGDGSPAARRTLERTIEQLAAYWAGTRRTFDLPLDLAAGTPFQQAVWRAATIVPFGQTVSYGELAQRIGRPAAMRAVGQALGANPIAIVVPCHRVLRSDGRLGGYAGGLANKRRLLAHEGHSGLQD
jgi:methylated-DNA-[protein]-cysteine S-methyltransferase